MTPLVCPEKSIEKSSVSEKLQEEARVTRAPRSERLRRVERREVLKLSNVLAVLSIVFAIISILVTILFGVLQLQAQNEQNLESSKFPEKFASEIAKLINRASTRSGTKRAGSPHVNPEWTPSKEPGKPAPTPLARLCADPHKLVGRFLPLRARPDPNAQVIARIPSGSTDLHLMNGHVIRTTTWWSGQWHKAAWSQTEYHGRVGFVAYDFVSRNLGDCENLRISFVN